MRAAQISRYGGTDVLQYVTDAPRPTISPDQVLVAVHSAGVNPFDRFVRQGKAQEMVQLDFPATLGGDLAGRVVEVGSDVDDYTVGDAVYGQANVLSGHGSFAELAPVKATSLARMPSTLDYAQAGAVPLAAVSAYQALVETMKVKADQKILIHGGAGGIGSMAIQIAHHAGAHVVTTVDSHSMEFARSLGADEIIDFHTQDFSLLCKDFDAVLDTVGGETTSKSYRVLASGGTLVSMVSEPDEHQVKQRNITAVHQFTRTTAERLKAVASLIESGAITVRIDKVFALKDAAEALEYLARNHPKGKVVIRISE